MDPKEHKISFEEANRRYAELNRQRAAGTLTNEQFDVQLKDLMVKDEEGRWWSKARSTGEWYRRTVSGEWVKDVPPVDQSPPPPPPPPSSPSPPRRRLLAAGGILVALVVLVGLVAVMVIRSGSAVPNVVGQRVSEAERSVAQDNYRIDVDSVRVDNQPKGTIISQDPNSGESTEPNSVISVVVSAGRPSDPGDIFRDDFSDSSSGWETNKGGEKEPWIVEYAIGGLRIFNPPPGSTLASLNDTAGTAIEDAIVEVDARVTTGAPLREETSWGLICRSADDSLNYYALGIYADGRPFIGTLKDNKWTEFATGSQSDAVLAGTATNHLRADCLGNRLALYINDRRVLQAENSEFEAGQVGLFASEEGDKIDILFDNFVVSSP